MKEEVFEEIDEYWSDQRNGEIWLDNKDLKPGTPEYFAEIESARFAYNYYMPDMLEFLSGAPGKKFVEVGCGMGMDCL